MFNALFDCRLRTSSLMMYTKQLFLIPTPICQVIFDIALDRGLYIKLPRQAITNSSGRGKT